MEKTLDIITIGEGLVELSSDKSLVVGENFTKFFGGDTLATAVSALRMGSNVGYITKLGHDCFGEYLLDAWQLEGLDTSQIKLGKGQNGVYFIGKTQGKNEVQYYRKKTAATQLSVDDINFEYIKQAKLVYATGFVQSLSLSCDEVVNSIFEYAKNNNSLVAYDPNYSKNVWSEEEAKEAFEKIAQLVDIIFIDMSTDAIPLFSTNSVDEIAKKLSDLAIKTIVLKEQEKGVHIIHNGDRQFVELPEHEVVDSTGDDAAFNGGFLHSILDGSSPAIAAKYAMALVLLQNKNIGAIKSIPHKEDVENLFKELYG